MVLISLLLLPLLVCAVEQPWDALRPFNSLAETLSDGTIWVVFLLSAALMVIAVLAYKRKQSSRHGFIALAFVFFFVKWLLKVIDIYLSPGHFFNWAGESLVELVIFTCLFIALFKR